MQKRVETLLKSDSNYRWGTGWFSPDSKFIRIVPAPPILYSPQFVIFAKNKNQKHEVSDFNS
ncbi:MAG: hypothetical protein ACI9V1_003425 [Spirosomataceae bacterium]|jgi:hypothetical protein